MLIELMQFVRRRKTKFFSRPASASFMCLRACTVSWFMRSAEGRDDRAGGAFFGLPGVVWASNEYTWSQSIARRPGPVLAKVFVHGPSPSPKNCFAKLKKRRCRA